MPALSHFLGLELAPDALRAIVLDDALDTVATEAVEFDQCALSAAALADTCR
jgi:xylulokinase